MKESKWLISGVILFLIGLWGGAFAMYSLPDWAKFPTFMTAALICLIGILCISKFGSDNF